MSSKTRLSVLAGASVVTLTGAGFAATTDADLQNARIADLERQISELRGEMAPEARANEMRAIVEDVLADSEARGSMLQGGSGWSNNGFGLSDSTGDFTLNFAGQLQIRAVASQLDNAPGGDDSRFGFENRRTRVAFSGNVHEWNYKIKMDIGSGASLLDGYVGRDIGNGWSMKVGQFKPQLLREENISSAHQQAVERSLVNEYFNQGRTQGIQFMYKAEQFRGSVMYHDGLRRANSAAVGMDTEYALNLRGDYLLAGNWDQFKDYAGWRGQEYGARIGAGVNFEREESGALGAEDETTTFTVDGQFEGDGWNAAAAVIINMVEVTGGTDRDELGLVLQGGYFFNDDWEGFIRYEFIDLDITGVDDISVLTFGANRYWREHNLKLTTDIGIGLDSIPSSFSGTGFRADNGMDDGQLVCRTQLQLLF